MRPRRTRTYYETRARSVLALLLSLGGASGLVGCDPPATIDAGSDVGAGPDAGTDAGPPPPSRPAPRPLLPWVDPFVGTGGIGYNDIGSAFPGPSRPFGMARPGPDGSTSDGRAAGFLHCSGYHTTDTEVRAFSVWRLHGIGINDGGAGAIMPVTDFSAPRIAESGYRADIRPDSEHASPGFYDVTLEAPAGGSGSMHVEITSTERVGLYRVSFDGAREPGFVIPLAHAHPGVEAREGNIVVIPDAREIEGEVLLDGGYSGRYGGQRIFFVARFDQLFSRSGTFSAGVSTEGSTMASGADAGAFVAFPASTASVRVAVAMSFLDVARARASLDAEAGDLDFTRVRTEAEAAWEDWLGRVAIEARTDRDFRLFYTALYHASLMPTLASEAGGAYRGIDGNEHLAVGFDYYTDLSLWDTYRTLHPWVHLAYPERGRDFVRSLMAMATDGGAYPRWPMGTGETGGMLGDPAAIVIADAWSRGVRDFDVSAALDLFDSTAFGDRPTGYGRGGMEPYLRLGYVTTEAGGSSAARTQEFAWADDALANLAAAAGRPDEEAMFRARGHNYRNVYDPAQTFFVGRSETGAFGELPNPNAWNDFYAEGNAWQYLWLAPHDAAGLAMTLGGETMALARLSAFFSRSETERRNATAPDWYWQANEPDIHAPFLFSLWGQPDETARWSAWAREEHYDDTPTGIPGNDDSGTMSAWYLFSALGIYPIAGSATYAIASPAVTGAVITRDAGDLIVEAPDAASGVVRVTELRVEGVARAERAIIGHEEIDDGATLAFELE